ncbi:MAG: hypothetical protein O7I42_18265, partial [Alphaproteobacteria bacterium]|nr:hypothetical protein [Alphaproteobacteria bacterium]
IRKQSALAAVNTLDKTLHQILPPMGRRILAAFTFLHSLGHKQTLGSALGTSALPPKADIEARTLDVRL